VLNAVVDVAELTGFELVVRGVREEGERRRRRRRGAGSCFDLRPAESERGVVCIRSRSVQHRRRASNRVGRTLAGRGPRRCLPNSSKRCALECWQHCVCSSKGWQTPGFGLDARQSIVPSKGRRGGRAGRRSATTTTSGGPVRSAASSQAVRLPARAQLSRCGASSSSPRCCIGSSVAGRACTHSPGCQRCKVAFPSRASGERALEAECACSLTRSRSSRDRAFVTCDGYREELRHGPRTQGRVREEEGSALARRTCLSVCWTAAMPGPARTPWS